MSLVNPKKLFKDVSASGSAIGAFNFVNYETLTGILNAAEKLNTPVILAVSEGAVRYMGMPFVRAMAKAAEKKYKVDFALHLDHGSNFEICKSAIDADFTSVMIDASNLRFEENIELTKKVCKYAHKHNVFCEGELGRISGIEEHVKVSEAESAFTVPNEAKKFIERTGVDSLAISIGTSHGAYKIKNSEKLRHDIVTEIKKLCPDTYLVLHGASSITADTVNEFNKAGGSLKETNGINESELKQAIKVGITKINVDSDIRIAFTAEVRKQLKENTSEFDLRKYFNPAINNVSKMVEYKITNIFKS